MATYKEIKGITIQTLDEDPVAVGAAWASGGNLNGGRAGIAGAGIQTANVGFGGITSNPPAAGTANTESYNGTSWTEVNNLNNDREITNGVGLYTAALCMGNDPPYSAAVESWDGTNWTNGTNLPAPRGYGAAFGTQTAAIYTGGYTDGDGSVSGSTLYWNGSSWTETGDLNTTRAFLSSSTNGTYTAAVVFGGPGSETKTESWNGSAWTEVNDLVSGAPVATGGGTQTSAFVVKGGVSVTTQTWDGTNWASAADAAVSASYSNRGGGGASNTVGIVYGGATNPGLSSFTTSTEEFTEPPATQAKLREGMLFLSGGTTLKGFGTAAGIPSTSWAAGAAQNSTRVRQAATGGNATISVAQLCGGYLPSSPPPNDYFTNTEQYNGSAWTEVNDLNTAKSSMSGFGTQTSAIVAGSPGGIPPQAQVEAWDGSSWAGTADLNNGRGEGTGAGLAGIAGIVAGGKIPTNNYQTHSETWDGTSWTETSNINTARSDLGAGGSQTSAVIFGGTPTPYDKCETWNGSSWTEVAELNEGRYGVQGGGISSSSALAAGGDDGSRVASTEFWNGTSWTELNNLSTARSHTQQCPGNAVSMVFSGGYPDSSASPAEEWEADAALSTVSVS
jgi:hypothetical protein